MMILVNEEETDVDHELVLKEKEKEGKLIDERLAQAKSMKSKLENIWSQLDIYQQKSLCAKVANIEEKRIKKRIIVGNTSHFVPLAHRESDDAYTHKWTVYARGTSEEPLLSTFIKKIRIFLHPSFEPNHIVDLWQPPYHLSRRGWGEFPITLQVHFRGNSSVNKPLDLIHPLMLDQSNSGKVINSPESIIDVELDKSALEQEDEEEEEEDDEEEEEEEEDFESSDEVTQSSIMSDEDLISENDVDSTATLVNFKSKKRRRANSTAHKEVPPYKKRTSTKTPFPPVSTHKKITYHSKTSLGREFTKEEDVVYEAARHYPLIGRQSTYSYPCASSESDYYSWSVGKRRAAERLRSVLLRNHAGVNWSTHEMIVFCRRVGLTPIAEHDECVLNHINLQPEKTSKSNHLNSKKSPPQSSATTTPPNTFQPTTKSTTAQAHFCKYCGTPHRPQDDFVHLQDKCRKRMKLSDSRPLNSCKVFVEDFSQYKNETTCNTCQALLDESKTIISSSSSSSTTLTNHTQQEISSVKKLLEEVGVESDSVMSTIMLNIMLKFAKHLVSHSTDIFEQQQMREPAAEGKDKILIPLHVYQAVIKCPQLDFLCDNLKTKNTNKRRKKE
ncbi:YEATS domain-containing protein [Acrasis kona]|uniref:YEATS domain-containing protein n=1 Tax=Acrasis kona TaxID=1008807 RepID=A0AAW2YWV3_9EUKA